MTKNEAARIVCKEFDATMRMKELQHTEDAYVFLCYSKNKLFIPK